jgi:hypothetical protein
MPTKLWLCGDFVARLGMLALNCANQVTLEDELSLTYVLESKMGNLILILLGLSLFATNPEQPEFDQFLRTMVTGKVQSGSAVVDMFAGTIVSGLAKENTVRKNYYLFSFYTVDLSVLATLGQDIPKQLEFLGIANQFIRLEE